MKTKKGKKRSWKVVAQWNYNQTAPLLYTLRPQKGREDWNWPVFTLTLSPKAATEEDMTPADLDKAREAARELAEKAALNKVTGTTWDDEIELVARALLALSSAPDAGEKELLRIIDGFLKCPEIADCAPDDKDPETDALERAARAVLSRQEKPR